MPEYDKLDPTVKTKESFYTEAAANLNGADQALQALGGNVNDEPVTLSLGKSALPVLAMLSAQLIPVILCLARGQPQIAQPMVERLLVRQPNNLIALTAHARLQFARRAHEAALQTYQKMLGLSPDMTPDPRIGLGLCAWMLGDRETAQRAWERALQRVRIEKPSHYAADEVGSGLLDLSLAPWTRGSQSCP